MASRGIEIDAVLSVLATDVSVELAATGWTRRRFETYGIATLTRDTHDGMTATAYIERRWPTSSDDFPVEIGVFVGVGYEPALNLMPLLTLRPWAALVTTQPLSVGPAFTATLPRAADATVVAVQLAKFIEDRAFSFASGFPDPSSIEAAMMQADGGEAEAPDDVADAAARHLTMLAALGRYADARALLADFPPGRDSRPLDQTDRRFIRALTRWLDDGGPAAPPIDGNSDHADRAARFLDASRPSWSDARARATSMREALEAARTRSKGKSSDELQDVVAAEFAQRGIEIAPSTIAIAADMLQLEQRPFGRAHAALRAVRLFASGGGDAIRTVRDGLGNDPAWAPRPERASYALMADLEHYVAVDVLPEANGWLARIAAESPRRLGPYVFVDVWLTLGDASGGAAVDVHIGNQHVGSVRAVDAHSFDEAMRDASVTSEDPFATGRLTQIDSQTPPILEIPRPIQAGSDGGSA